MTQRWRHIRLRRLVWLTTSADLPLTWRWREAGPTGLQLVSPAGGVADCLFRYRQPLLIRRAFPKP